MKYTNEEVIEGFRKENQRIIQYCYEVMQPMVAKLILTNSGKEEDVKEVLAYCISTFYNNCRKSDFALTAKFSTYICAIARNKWLKELEKRGKYIIVEQLTENIPNGIDNEIETAEINSIVQELFRKLPEDCQKIIQCKHEEGKSHQEIAQLLDISSKQYARTKLNRCKGHLAKLILESPHYKDLLDAFPFLKKIRLPKSSSQKINK